MNPFDIGKPCIEIASSEVLFEQYIQAFNRDKYDIGVQNDDAIKHNQILFDFMQQTFNRLDGLYLKKYIILIDTIKRDKFRKKSASEIEKLNIEKSPETK